VVEHLLEHGGLEEAHASGVVDDVPNDGRSIIGGGNGLGVILVDLDIETLPLCSFRDPSMI